MSIKIFGSAAGRISARFGCFMALALPATLIPVDMAQASGAANLNCVRSRGSVACAAAWGEFSGGIPLVVQVPRPRNDAEAAASAERERQWLARCQPVVRHDRFGVGRYYYAAAGCEFGKGTD